MTENTKKIRTIVNRGLDPVLTHAGFHRHSENFSRKYGEALHVVSFQLGKYNNKDLGKFTLNVGVHFPAVATLLYGKDPMPVNPKESRCLIRTRVGQLIPGRPDHWWTVTANTNVEETAEEVAAVCGNYVLSWLEQFTTISGMSWKLPGFILQDGWAEAAANVALGDRARAAECVEAELRSISASQAFAYPANARKEQSAKLRKWAVDHGIAITK